MSYVIKYNYNYGDSNSKVSGAIETLNLKFESLEVAKDNLRRIKEHYLFYQEIRGYRYTEKQRTAKKIFDEAQSKDWAKLKEGNIKKYNFCLVLQSDNGESFQLCAPWCGYFESLNSAWIEVDHGLDGLDTRIDF